MRLILGHIRKGKTVKRILSALFLFSAMPAFAQQAPDPAFLQRALGAVEQQRNQALNSQAVAEARAAGLSDDLAKAQARIKEMETKSEKPKE